MAIGTQPEEKESAARLAAEGVTVDHRKCAYIVRESTDQALAEGSH